MTHERRKTRLARVLQTTLVVTIALVGALVLATSVRAQTAPSLAGEEFHQFVINPALFHVNGTCNPSGTSTLSFSVTAAAVGPYPGTVNATGFASFGPQVNPPTTQAGFLARVGAVTEFHEDFQITSRDTTVTGTKDLTTIAGNPSSEAACTQAPDGTTTFVFFANATYDAVIDTPTGEFHDSGLTYSQTQGIFDQQNNLLGWGFSEFFLVSNGVVPVNTTGSATGGGQINHVDGSPGAVFGFTVYSMDSGTILGQCDVVDGAVHVRCDTVTAYQQVGNQASFSGTGDVNGAPTTYRIVVQDNSESGIGQDTFSISTSSGYSASGVLTQGNVQVH